MRDTVVIMKEGNCPRPHCPACDMFVPWAELDLRHPETALCAWREEMNRRHMVEEEDQAGLVTAIQDYDRPLEILSSFKYLGRLLIETDEDWMAVIDNIWKARKS